MLYIRRKNNLLVDGKTKRSRKRKNSLEYQEKRMDKKIKYYSDLMRMFEWTYAVLHRDYEDHVNNNVTDATS